MCVYMYVYTYIVYVCVYIYGLLAGSFNMWSKLYFFNVKLAGAVERFLQLEQ